ncbi:DHA1 family bicyclomycin/chloramphenicol resistance-like MFS transporter [Rhodoblastus sphagnicola]|uniref:Bcr/CflA family multidrug efflux MFS transporter n=1 Tax=Rhodoblastus sphagnicola TaxID=333368 RepID=UPI001304880D|nr:Bcr/CflA family multidrug efflux MFS transporter [Rhodoblastus sphagnicola]MBB4198262.1 DHA1 family bicyclomycin/chloramphenicol resistance-like MFS transporter [Rhodoblastus sphagnicola]
MIVAGESRPPPRAMIPVLGALSAFGPASIDMYLPALPAIGLDFAVAPERVQASIGAFLAGFALGMLVYGPLSDRFGRRPAVAAGIALYMAASLGCAVAPDMTSFIALRFAQALGGGAATALARAMVRDLYATNQGARVMSLMMLVTSIMPLVAPFMGAAVFAGLGWRAIFWALAAFGAATLSAYLLLVPETLPPERRRKTSPRALAGAYARILRTPRVLRLVLAGAAAYGGLMAYITGTPFAYIVHFQVAPTHFPFLFALGALAVALGNTLNAALVVRLGFERMLRVGGAIAGLAGALLLVEAQFPPSLAVLVATVALYLVCVNLTAANAVAGVMALHPEQAGAASALFGAGQFGLGALCSAAVGLFAEEPRGLCLVMGAAGVVCAGAVALLAFGRGKGRIPRRSR